MNIVLDLDGVLADFAGGYSRLFGGRLLLPEQSISKEQWKIIDGEKSFWRDLPILPGGRYLASLGEIPENVYILTSRNEKKTRTQTFDWLQEYDIAMASEAHVIFANPRAAKVEYLSQLSPAKFLDDSISNVDFCGTVKGIEATLMLQPYNGPCALKYFPSMEITNNVESWIKQSLR